MKYEGSSYFEVLKLVPLRLISPPKLVYKAGLSLHSLLFSFELNTLISSILLLFELFDTSQRVVVFSSQLNMLVCELDGLNICTVCFKVDFLFIVLLIEAH